MKILNLKRNQLIYLLIGTLATLLYSNTLFHEYALDDEMVIHNNLYVHQGLKGVGNILTKDSYQGFLDKQNANSPLSGGRYRPLSIITFAIEQQLFSSTLTKEYLSCQKELDALKFRSASPETIQQKSDELRQLNKQMLLDTLQLATLRHSVQILLFAISMLVFFHLLRVHIFEATIPAMLCTLLFIAHPLHSEVVANIKSRDEILSFLFMCLTLHQAFNWHKSPSNKGFILSLACFALSLLSKEYAVAIPLILITGLYLFKSVSFKQTFSKLTLAFILMDGLFLLIRNAIIHQKKIIPSTDVLNDPYVYAGIVESFCSRISLILEYIRILFFPLNLSSDYSYPQIPYTQLSDARFWISLFLYAILLGVTAYLFYKRSKLAWYLIIITVFIFMVNNIFFRIGATLGERLLYHSSAGFCMIVTAGVLYASERFFKNYKSIVSIAVIIIISIPLSWRTFTRNADWKNDYTLFTHDVQVVPNSALANGNAGSAIFNKAYSELDQIKNQTHKDSVLFHKKIQTAVPYIRKAIALHPKHVNSHINLGLICYNLNQLDSAAYYWKKAAALFNGTNPTLQIYAQYFFSIGLKDGSNKNYRKAIEHLEVATALNQEDPAIWGNLGGAYFMNGNFEKAAFAFNRSLMLNPNQPKTAGGKTAAENFSALLKKVSDNPTNENIRKEAIQIFRENGFPEIADTIGK